jgi:hypothetical protein
MSMTKMTSKTANNASKTRRRVRINARKIRGIVIGKRRGIVASVVMIESGVPRTTIDRLTISL